ncbi:bifunctional sulfate adenylyltransferase/adenylylsulfate kinase [Marinicella meishanensis]|uniref:bifunctional sulfate adenylyltransferase/adenylylsulfate kinase n=1 Tax=Marinicella meishanensis TaxID=2873263 RepID=UPI001CC06230|nr:bifunctional sulfate adenylyltransferase/adenylylsulfate kinase [Marinicella sp. NBU2979]
MNLIEAHGGELVNLIPSQADKEQRQQLANEMPDWDLKPRQVCDIELLLNGAFSPLTGFMQQADYQAVLKDMRLADGTLWPMPITLDVDEKTKDAAVAAGHLTLRDEEGVVLAVLKVADVWAVDRAAEAQAVYGTTDEKHPAVHHLMNQTNDWYLGGELLGLQLPTHYDYKQHRHTPQEIRAKFKKLSWSRVVAFQTRNPMHRAHQELTFRAAQRVEANLLIHPVVGMTKPGDIDHFTRVRCYEQVMDRYPERTTALSLLPLAMRMGGPREALWHAIIRKNYGCTHIIVGRDHAGPGDDSNGQPFYDPYAAQELLQQHEAELGIQMVEFEMMVYSQDKAQYIPVSEVNEGDNILNISGTELRRRLQLGLEIPEWFSYPEVVTELRKSYPPRNKQGFTVFFTGLSGSGKSTIANALRVKLMEMINRPVTLLDGDVVRKHLSSELGFSKEHRNINVQRIGYVASEITKNGGVAICAPIAPYEKMRAEVRGMIEPLGGFLEIHVSTPLEECEKRDRKGLYALARKGVIKEFTGISDPYEAPATPEVEINTLNFSPDQATQRIVLKLEAMGLIG